MENNKAPSFFFIIVALILGSALYKQFDFQQVKFEKPALAILYSVVLVFSIYGLIKNLRNK